MSHLSTISWQEWVLFQWDVDDDDICTKIYITNDADTNVRFNYLEN
jgi:hypothetical protein